MEFLPDDGHAVPIESGEIMSRRPRRNHAPGFKAKVARASIGRYLRFYNERRPHASLDGMTPDQAYFAPLPFRSAA